MAKRKSKQKSKANTVKPQRHKLINEVQGVAFIAVAIFIFVCLIIPNDSFLPKNTKAILLGIFGLFAYVLPFLLIFIGICRITLKNPKLHIGKLICSMVLLGSIVGLIHILTQSIEIKDVSYWGYISNSFYAGQRDVGMGAIVALYAFPLYKLLGVTGLIILFAALILAMVILLFNFSLKATGDRVKSGIDNFAERTKKVMPRRQISMFSDNLREDEDYKHTPHIALNDEVAKRPVRIKHYGEEEENNSPDAHVPSTPTPPQEKSNVPKLQKPYKFPPVSLLNLPPTRKGAPKLDHNEKIQRLEGTLRSFGINAQVVDVTVGPAITRYELTLERGTRVSRILTLSDDIALSMAAMTVRIEAPIPGKAAVGIEIPNESISMVTLREVIDSEAFRASQSKVSFALGKNITGETIVADISKMPHLLIAGQTGSGKSVCINCLITSILYKASPDEVKLILVDPKKVELNVYNGIPHLLTPVVTDPKKAAGALQYVVREMEKRYEMFANKKAKDITRFNEIAVEEGEKPMYRIVVIVDELNDLMMVAQGEVEDSVMRIAQLARAAGIYLVLATQRPSVNVITGVIKANIPSRIAFAVASTHDSRTILDSIGAEKLLGRGDMLLHQNGDNKPTRVQGAFVDEQEVEKVVEFIKATQVEADFIPEDQLVLKELRPSRLRDGLDGENDEIVEDDDLFLSAVEYTIECGQASISSLQRRLKVGYARAGRLIDDMERRGIVGGSQGSKPREVLITKEQFWNSLGKE